MWHSTSYIYIYFVIFFFSLLISSPPPPSIFPLPPTSGHPFWPFPGERGRIPAVLAWEGPDPGHSARIRPFWPEKGRIPANPPGSSRFGRKRTGSPARTAGERPDPRQPAGKGLDPVQPAGTLRLRLRFQLPTEREKKKNEREERESFHFKKEKKNLTWKFHIRL
jgi:hypothetical protein